MPAQEPARPVRGSLPFQLQHMTERQRFCRRSAQPVRTALYETGPTRMSTPSPSLLSRADAAQADHPTPASRRCWPSWYPPAPDPAWVRPCRRIDLPRQRRSPAAKHRAGRSELVAEINSQPADPQVVRLLSLWDICSATLASADSSGTRTEHFTESEVSTLLRPLRSSVTCGNELPHSGSPVVC